MLVLYKFSVIHLSVFISIILYLPCSAISNRFQIMVGLKENLKERQGGFLLGTLKEGSAYLLARWLRCFKVAFNQCSPLSVRDSVFSHHAFAYSRDK